MRCPECKKADLEISTADVNLDRKGLRVRLVCTDNVCEFSKILELDIEDIIGIGKSHETEAQTRQAIANAMTKGPEKHGRKEKK